MDELVVEKVLTAVEQIPSGRVVSYGDVADVVGIGPRQVGAVMSRYGAAVAWWRVTNATGEFPESLRRRAREHWAAENIGWKVNGRGCRIDEFRHSIAILRADYEAAIADVVDQVATGETDPGRAGPTGQR